MKIKQYGIKLISNKKILDIIQLLKHDNKAFQKHTVKKVVVWNSRILYWLYSLINLDIFGTTFYSVWSGDTAAYYNSLFHIIEIFNFNSIKHYKKVFKDKREYTQFSKVQFALNLSHEFRHNYQSIFCPNRHSKDTMNYSSKKWEDIWIEKDATKYSKRFLTNNHKAISSILEVDTDWRVSVFTDKKED